MTYTFTNVRAARRYFREHIQPGVEKQYRKGDIPALDYSWGVWLDSLHRAGEISDRAYDNWTRTD